MASHDTEDRLRIFVLCWVQWLSSPRCILYLDRQYFPIFRQNRRFLAIFRQNRHFLAIFRQNRRFLRFSVVPTIAVKAWHPSSVK